MTMLRAQLFEGFRKYGTTEHTNKLIDAANAEVKKLYDLSQKDGWLRPATVDDSDETESEDENDDGLEREPLQGSESEGEHSEEGGE